MRQLLKLLQSAPVFAIREDVGLQLRAAAEAILNREGSAGIELYNEGAATPTAMSEFAQVSTPKGEQRIAVMPVHGVMLAEDQICGPVGMLSMSAELYELADNTRVAGVVLDIMSPGGQVAGLQELLNAADYLRARKPLIAYVNSHAASAAYWLASRADKIILNGPAAEVGSIGTMLHYLDASEAMRRKGIREIKVVSTLSPDKNSINMTDPTEGDMELMASELLDPLTRIFQAEVSAAREGVQAAALTGKMYLASDALEMGLADGIGSINDAIEMAATMATNLATQPAANADGRNSNSMSKPKSFSGRIFGMFGGASANDVHEAPVETPDGDDLGAEPVAPDTENADEAEDLEVDLEDAALEDDVEALFGHLHELTARLDALEQSVVKLTATVAALAKTASAATPAPIAASDFSAAAPVKKPWSGFGPTLPPNL